MIPGNDTSIRTNFNGQQQKQSRSAAFIMRGGDDDGGVGGRAKI